jgi:hypothetical protein
VPGTGIEPVTRGFSIRRYPIPPHPIAHLKSRVFKGLLYHSGRQYNATTRPMEVQFWCNVSPSPI